MEKIYSPRSQRRNLLFYLDILNQETHELLGHLGDISKDGIMIIAEKPIAYNSIKNISIQLSDFEEFDQESLEARVEIRWMKADSNPNLQRIGCKFVEIDPDDLPIIEEIQEILGF